MQLTGKPGDFVPFAFSFRDGRQTLTDADSSFLGWIGKLDENTGNIERSREPSFLKRRD
jgi:hypothetical protein